MRFLPSALLFGSSLIGLSLADDPCYAATSAVINQTEIDAFKAKCKTLTSTLTISTSYQGEVNLDGIEEIQGYLTIGAPDPYTFSSVTNGSVTGISSSTLKSVESTFGLYHLPNLTTVSFPALRSAKKFELQYLPKLSKLDLGDGLDKVAEVWVSSTGLTDISNLVTETADDWVLDYNSNLTEADMSKLTSVDQMTVQGNNANLSLDLSAVTAGGSLYFTSLKTINLDSLTTFNSQLSLNKIQDNLTFPALTRASGIQVTAQLNNISLDFPVLKTVHGDVNIRDYITAVSLPALEGVDGDFSIMSYNNMSCAGFGNLTVSGDKYHCIPNYYYNNEEGQKHWHVDPSYTNAVVNVSVGNPANETFGSSGASATLGTTFSFVVPVFAAMAVVL